jgi:hypothetical protein
MNVEAPDRVTTMIILAANGLLWFLFCYRLIRDWYVAPWTLQLWGISLAIGVPLLWRDLIREKSGVSILIGVSFLFIGLAGLVLRIS